MLLSGKTALVVGASEGLGEAVGESLAQAGASVWLAARNEEALKRSTQALKDRGLAANYTLCDVTRPSTIQHSVTAVTSAEGKIDILVNCAGVWIEGPLEDLDELQIRRAFDVNILGTIFTVRAILPHMKQQERGQIVNVISTSGIEPEPNWSIYVATKFALRGFTESLRLQLTGSNIKVIAVYPGGIGTNFYKNAGIELSTTESWMMKRKDVAEAICQLICQPDDVLISHAEIRKMSTS